MVLPNAVRPDRPLGRRVLVALFALVLLAVGAGDRGDTREQSGDLVAVQTEGVPGTATSTSTFPPVAPPEPAQPAEPVVVTQMAPPVEPPPDTTAPPSTAPKPPDTTKPAPPSTPPTPKPTTPPTTKPRPPADHSPLRSGDRGERVQALQERLEELRFWIGSTDGQYGSLTVQAVMAFQKANGLPITGAASRETLEALEHAGPVQPASRSGTLAEIDKARQLLIFVRDGAAVWVFNTSTGTELPYTDPDGNPQMADTPTGRFKFSYEVDGNDEGPLGHLYRPKYFHHDGVAIHGYSSVPARPASHGCARVSFEAMDFIWSSNLAPLRTAIWVYGESPAPAS